MARGVNKVILVGNIGKDPEVRYSQGGGAVATVTLATSETWRDKTSGDKQERTEWHRVVFFGKLGEIVGQYVKKGAQLYVEGALRTRKWQDQAGNDRYTTEIVANEMQMLGSKRDGVADYSDYPEAAAPAPRQQAAPRAQPSKAYGAMEPRPMGDDSFQAPAGFDQFDDDIPF